MNLKFINILLVSLCLTSVLTSCDTDPDHNVARILSGEWYGDFGMYYTYEHHGRVYTFDSYDTDIKFFPDHDYATYGTGYQIDYYAHGPYEYQCYSFKWEILDTRIYLDYIDAPELSTCISDYEVVNNHFTGWFDGTDSFFDLVKTENYYDSFDYYYGDGVYYYDRDNWYNRYSCASMNNNTLKSISIDDDTDDGHIVERGNRYKK